MLNKGLAVLQPTCTWMPFKGAKVNYVRVVCRLFVSTICPINCMVQAFGTFVRHYCTLQTYFLKKLSGLSPQITGYAMRLEFGRRPIDIRTFANVLLFLDKINSDGLKALSASVCNSYNATFSTAVAPFAILD